METGSGLERHILGEITLKCRIVRGAGSFLDNKGNMCRGDQVSSDEGLGCE